MHVYTTKYSICKINYIHTHIYICRQRDREREGEREIERLSERLSERKLVRKREQKISSVIMIYQCMQFVALEGARAGGEEQKVQNQTKSCYTKSATTCLRGACKLDHVRDKPVLDSLVQHEQFYNK